jgi:predicted DNA-binding protein (UPF0251 family)
MFQFSTEVSVVVCPQFSKNVLEMFSLRLADTSHIQQAQCSLRVEVSEVKRTDGKLSAAVFV